jgi:deoxyribodipyrimidine photo-lyase
MRAIHWFRADLRAEDNSALHEAQRRADNGVIGVFLIADEQWREHDWAPIKVDLMRRTLVELSERLAVRNIPLLIRRAPRFDDAPKALTGLAEEHDCDAIFCNIEYEVNERRRDERVEHACEKVGLDFVALHDQTVLTPDSVRTNDDGFYSVFTPYKRKWLKTARELGVSDTVPMPKKQTALPIAAEEVPDALGSFDDARDDWADLWPAGEANAKRALTRFVEDRIRDYDDRRDIPGEDGTSRLSPFLALGVLSPRQCLAAAMEANRQRMSGGAIGIDTWISEIIWREFYRHVLVGWPRVCMNRPFRLESEAVRWRDDPEGLQAWKDGRTGYPIVDAGMRQLASTGWMHNRVRMIVATFLTKHLLIDWREGERHFMRHLVDGDLASNNGGWQWSASTGTDAAPYFRVFNPFSQSKRFDPDGVYIRSWVNELRDVPAKLLHDERDPDDASDLLDRPGGGQAYPRPLVQQKAARQRAIEAFRTVMKGS